MGLDRLMGLMSFFSERFSYRLADARHVIYAHAVRVAQEEASLSTVRKEATHQREDLHSQLQWTGVYEQLQQWS